MTPSRTTSNPDGLEVRPMGDGFAIFDTLTEKFVSSKTKKRWANERLEQARRYRPLVTRWVFGIPTAVSRELGVTSERR